MRFKAGFDFQEKKKINRNKILGYLEYTSITIILVCVLLQVREMLTRSDLGFGLTDEAYGISFSLDRAINGQIGVTPFYTDIASYFMSLVDFNLQHFRMIGFIFLFFLGLILYFISQKLESDVRVKQVDFYLLFLFVFATLFISSSFRYLLITPSYQWFVMTSTVLTCALVLFEPRLKSKVQSGFVWFSVALLIVFSAMSRPTSGFLTLILTSAFVVFTDRENGRKRALHLNVYFIFLICTYLFINGSVALQYLTRYWTMREWDPKGSNLFLEIWDVTHAFFIFAAIIFSSHWLNGLYRLKFQNQIGSKLRLILGGFFLVLVVITLFISFPFKDFEHLLTFAIVGLLGTTYAKHSKNLKWYANLVFCSLPLLSQFGSNISASYLMPPFLLSALLLTLTTRDGVGVSIETLRFSETRFLRTIVYFIMSIFILILQTESSKLSYETSLPTEVLTLDPLSSLRYSPEKVRAITEFRSNAELESNSQVNRVIDFSYWHPGVILYLGAIQFPSTTIDIAFSKTVDKQVNAILIDLERRSFKTMLIIVRSDQDTPSNTCKRLSEHLLDIDLRDALLERSFNPYVRDSSIYRSSSVDATLYPLNIALLKPCI